MPENAKLQWVIQVVGTSYSGSSLLNLLLDSQPNIRGLGEACHVYDPPGRVVYCTTCHTNVEECPFFKTIDRSNFYKSCLDQYGCRILVDSSKKKKMRTLMQRGLAYLVVFLSKSPHEFAHSYVRHNKGADVRKSFEEYIRHYRVLLECYSRRELDAQEISHMLTAVTYRELAQHPAQTIQRICAFCNEPFHADAFAKWTETDSHIVGGNGAVAFQVDDTERFFETDSKYRGKRGCIFLDDYWRQDTQFVEACEHAYTVFRTGLETILPHLHQPSIAELLEDLSTELVSA